MNKPIMLLSCVAVLCSTSVSLAQNGLPAEAFNQTRIAFISNRDSNGEVYTMFADRSGVKRLTQDALRDRTPDYSPVEDKIAFASPFAGDYEIVIMNGDGSGRTRLTNSPGWDYLPAFSPDGTRIAYASFRVGHEQIYIINVDGTGRQLLSENPHTESHPSWSPDGSKIVFDSNQINRRFDIFVMNPDGSNRIRLTSHDAVDESPRFSPDGSKIAFYSSRQSGRQQIHIMNADGTGVTRVTNESVQFEDAPDWSPDGSKIVYTLDTFPSQLYMISPDGTGREQITFAEDGDNWYPAFGRLPTVAPPETFQTNRGVPFQGGLFSLLMTDDNYLWIEARRPSSVSQPSIQIELTGTAPSDDLVVLSFTLEASAMRDTVPQWIDLYNYDLDDWERLDTRNATTNDSVVNVRITDEPNRYVQPATAALRARVSYYDPGIPVAFWFARIDQAVWIATPR